MDVKNIEIVIPESLEEITLSQIMDLEALKDKELEPAQEIIEVFKLFLGLDENEILLMSMDQIADLYQRIKKALTIKPELRRSFKLGEITYVMTPDITDINLGEYTDMDRYITPASVGAIDITQAAKFMTVLFRPIKSGDPKTLYEITKYKGTKDYEVMLNAPSDIYVNSVSFFLTLRLELLQNLSHYLQTQVIQNKAIADKLTKSDGDGLEQLTTLPKEIYQSGMKSYLFHLDKYLQNYKWIKRQVISNEKRNLKKMLRI